jgi:hypothetical protein
LAIFDLLKNLKMSKNEKAQKKRFDPEITETHSFERRKNCSLDHGTMKSYRQKVGQKWPKMGPKNPSEL